MTSSSARKAVPWLLLGSLVPAALLVADALLGSRWSGTFPHFNFAFSFGLPAAGLACIAAGLWRLGGESWGGWPARLAALLGLTEVLLGVLVPGASMTNVIQGTAPLSRAGEAVFWTWAFLPLLLGGWLAWTRGRPRWPWAVFALSPLWWVLLTLLPSLINPAWLLPVASPEDAGDLELWLSLAFLPWAVLAWAIWRVERLPKPNSRRLEVC